MSPRNPKVATSVKALGKSFRSLPEGTPKPGNAAGQVGDCGSPVGLLRLFAPDHPGYKGE